MIPQSKVHVGSVVKHIGISFKYSLIKNEKVPVHGNGEYVRNWIHVEDNVNALYSIINLGEENNYYHISADEEYSVKEIVEMIADIFGYKFIDPASVL